MNFSMRGGVDLAGRSSNFQCGSDMKLLHVASTRMGMSVGQARKLAIC